MFWTSPEGVEAGGGGAGQMQDMQAMVTGLSAQLDSIKREVTEAMTRYHSLQVLNGHGADSHGMNHTVHAADHHADHHAEHAHFSLAAYTVPFFHVFIDLSNAIGVAIMVFAALGVFPSLLREIIPGMFCNEKASASHGRVLQCRMQLSRGIMLGMDFMVASDVVETLCGHVDILKLICIVAIRSWLGWERGKEVEHMSHELEHWKKAQNALLTALGSDVTQLNISEKIRAVFDQFDVDGSGHISVEELRTALGTIGVKTTVEEVKTMLGPTEEMDFDQFEHLIRRMVIASGGL
mmetsp:Transcript_1443/g.3203  ORF Transcript_1443/g.3203 Transcript_1443/m.3203 type:complete len:294 (-) Transcript_1443:285-1166(-)